MKIFVGRGRNHKHDNRSGLLQSGLYTERWYNTALFCIFMHSTCVFSMTLYDVWPYIHNSHGGKDLLATLVVIVAYSRYKW